MKIKMHMDCQEEFIETVFGKIFNEIPYINGDDVYEFDIEIKNIKDITDEVGVDEDGCRAFYGVEIQDE